MKRGKTLWLLFLSMMKIGAFTFGGGYAMIALLEHEFVEKRGWIGKDEFLDLVAIAESTPGPIAINSATYIGYGQAGFLGALCATLGMVIPSFVIITLISFFFDAFLAIPLVASAFRGIRVAVVFLILSAGVRMFRKSKKDLLSVLILGATVVAMVLLSLFAVRFSSVFYILIAAAIGLFVFALSRAGKEGKS